MTLVPKFLTTLAAASLGTLLAMSAGAADKKTERLWKANCASCHGADGKAQTEQGTKMGIGDITTAAWQKEWTDEKIKTAILEGNKSEKDGKKKEMEPFKDKLKPDQVDALVGFVRSLAK